MAFRFTKLEIPDIVLIEPDRFEDERGSFMETFRGSAFEANGIPTKFAQDNQSVSRKGVLRGMHWQLIPKAHGKLVRVVSGSGYDVAIDIRKGSPHYGKWVGVGLSAGNRRMVWVPEGFAHGFLAMEDNTVLLYKQTVEYSKEHERGLMWNDPDVGIRWPIENPILSKKDMENAKFGDIETNFAYKK